MLEQSNNEVKLPVSNLNECHIYGVLTDNNEISLGCRLPIEMKNKGR